MLDTPGAQHSDTYPDLATNRSNSSAGSHGLGGARQDLFSLRNAATRIEMFDELSDLATAALRAFFRRAGVPHVLDEVVLPLLAEGDSQVFAAVRDRPWPPWGLGGRTIVGVLQTHLVADACWGLSPVYVADEDLSNIGMQAALYKEALDFLAVDPGAEVDYLVAEGSLLADQVLSEIGFERTDDVFVTEAARYLTYRLPAQKLRISLGLDQVDTVDLLAHTTDKRVFLRNATFHSVIYLGSKADWTIDRPDVAAEITRLVRGGHYSKPGGVPTGTGRYLGGESTSEIAQPVLQFLGPDLSSQLLAYTLENRDKFAAGTVVELGSNAPTVNERIRRSSTLDDLGQFNREIVNRIKQHLDLVRQRLDVPAFPIGDIELQITASGDGDYFRIHPDSDGKDGRELSFVYFFFSEPRRFSGGELRIFEAVLGDEGLPKPTDRSATLVPRNDMAVFFPSRHEHEVLPVRVPSKEFEGSRFTVTGWVHRD
jgi:hypothetical protein